MKPLLLFSIIGISVALLESASAQSSGEWSTGITDTGDLIYAATTNDSDNLLGQYCSTSTGTCMWLLGIGTACKEGDQYPILANSDAGASHILVYCSAKLDNGLYRYVFTDFDAIDDIVRKGLRVGFALPLQADQFRVIRFDLGGSNRAITLMRAAAEKAHEQSMPKNTGTKDQDL